MRRITDISTFIGISLAFTLVVLAIIIGSNESGSSPLGFLDIKSFLIVLGGTFFLTTACFNIKEVMKTNQTVLRTVFYNMEKPEEVAIASLELAEISRKKGILALQKYDYLVKRNPFFEKGVSMIVDGITFEDAEKIMRNEITSTIERHKKGSAILKKAAEISPAMGLIGTLIGLIQMLGNLDDPSAIGPAMAVALLTTLYGATLAYMVFLPLASKLDRNSVMEALIMNIYMNTVTSIGKKENPRRLEMFINSILPPSKRVNYFR